jgi:heat shock protein HslJ
MRTDECTLALGILALALACAKAPESRDEPPATVTASSTLAGQRWRLVELEGQPAISGGGAREPHLIFSRRYGLDRVGGATGCNTMGGTYTIDGARIRFSQLFSTKMACVEEGRMRQESRFLNVLESVDRYAVSGDTLALSAGNAVVARFVKG